MSFSDFWWVFQTRPSQDRTQINFLKFPKWEKETSSTAYLSKNQNFFKFFSYKVAFLFTSRIFARRQLEIILKPGQWSSPFGTPHRGHVRYSLKIFWLCRSSKFKPCKFTTSIGRGGFLLFFFSSFFPVAHLASMGPPKARGPLRRGALG